MCCICVASSYVLPHSECIPFDCYFIIRINIIYLSRVSACCSPKKEIHRVDASAVTHFGTIVAMALDAIAVGSRSFFFSVCISVDLYTSTQRTRVNAMVIWLLWLAVNKMHINSATNHAECVLIGKYICIYLQLHHPTFGSVLRSDREFWFCTGLPFRLSLNQNLYPSANTRRLASVFFFLWFGCKMSVVVVHLWLNHKQKFSIVAARLNLLRLGFNILWVQPAPMCSHFEFILLQCLNAMPLTDTFITLAVDVLVWRH